MDTTMSPTLPRNQNPAKDTGIWTSDGELIRDKDDDQVNEYIRKMFLNGKVTEASQPSFSKWNGLANSEVPGGDCQNLCSRHQRIADRGTSAGLQKAIEDLPELDRHVVSNVWSQFSASPARRRKVILKGILAIACSGQLRFLREEMDSVTRFDPFDVFPKEISLKILSYLDAFSLCQATQVSHHWHELAEDDILWRNMCAQHIERKCKKCGWGLPLLSSRQKYMRLKVPRETNENDEPSVYHIFGQGSHHSGSLDHNALDRRLPNASISDADKRGDLSLSNVVSSLKRDQSQSDLQNKVVKRSKTTSEDGAAHTIATDAASAAAQPLTRPWKSVYSERLSIERNWRSGNYVRRNLKGHTDSVTCLQIRDDLSNPSYPILMTGSWDRTVRIWNIEQGVQIGIIEGHSRGLRTLQFDDVKLITGSMNGVVKIWNWRTGQCLRSLEGHTNGVLSLCYDSSILVTGSADTTIRLWNFRTGESFALHGHEAWVNSVALWDAKAGTVNCSRGSSSATSGSSILEPAKSPDDGFGDTRGKFLFSSSDDMTIRIWDLHTRECIKVLADHVGPVQAIRPLMVPQDHITIRAADFPPFYRYTRSGTRESSSVIGLTGNSDASNAIFNDDDQVPLPIAVSASLDNQVKIWNIATGSFQTLFGHIEGIWDVSVDQLRIATAGHDRTIKIWDRDSGRCLHTLIGHTQPIVTIGLKDQYIVSGSDDGSVILWHFGARK